MAGNLWEAAPESIDPMPLPTGLRRDDMLSEAFSLRR